MQTVAPSIVLFVCFLFPRGVFTAMVYDPHYFCCECCMIAETVLLVAVYYRVSWPAGSPGTFPSPMTVSDHTWTRVHSLGFIFFFFLLLLTFWRLSSSSFCQSFSLFLSPCPFFLYYFPSLIPYLFFFSLTHSRRLSKLEWKRDIFPNSNKTLNLFILKSVSKLKP